MLLIRCQEGHLACKKLEWWGADVVICLERGTDLHVSQLMPLPLTVSCFSKIQIGFTFLVSSHPGSPRQRAIKRACVCVYHVMHCIWYISNKQHTHEHLMALCPGLPGWARRNIHIHPDHQTSFIIFLHLHCESKKQDTKFLPITSPNINRFSNLSHWQTR